MSMLPSPALANSTASQAIRRRPTYAEALALAAAAFLALTLRTRGALLDLLFLAAFWDRRMPEARATASCQVGPNQSAFLHKAIYTRGSHTVTCSGR